MTIPVQINWVKASDHQEVHRRIEYIGGRSANGRQWGLSEIEAIAGIKADKWDFYVMVADCAITVFIAKTENGDEYLKTLMDGYYPDYLLALPDQPNDFEASKLEHPSTFRRTRLHLVSR